MDVILLERIRNLGHLGDKVKVKSGYGRNYLIPQGKALPATNSNIAQFETRRAELERIAKEALATAQQRADSLSDIVVEITAKASDEGKLFGSVSIYDVADALNRRGLAIEKKEVLMPHGPIREIGEHDVAIQLHTDVLTSVKVHVVSERSVHND